MACFVYLLVLLVSLRSLRDLQQWGRLFHLGNVPVFKGSKADSSPIHMAPKSTVAQNDFLGVTC